HSLLAMQMISRIREIVGLDASLASIFAAPVLSEFASKLEGLTTEGQAPPPIASWKRGARLPLSFGQQRLWFINRLEPGSSSYNVPAALRLTGRLEIRALAGSFAEIVQRHEVLRTVFVLQDGELEQRICGTGQVPLPVVDLSGLEEREQDELAQRLVNLEA